MAASIEKRARPVNPWLQLVRVFGLFLGGGVTGLILTWWAAPDSGVAAAISVMLLPTAFAAGLLTWSGLDFLFALVNLLRGRAQVSSPELASKTRKWFVPLSLALTGPGGLAVAAVPGGRSVVVTLLAHVAAGWLYGRLAGSLAAIGYIPAPH